MSRKHGSLIKTRIAAAAVALVMPALASAPANAATATFPIVQDCSSFGDFYSGWSKLPNNLYATDTRWVPQGLAYDSTHRWLITSYYDGRDGVDAADKWPSMLVITNLNGKYLKRVMINTANVGPGGHAGGLGVAKGNLYVASTDNGPRVTKISLKSITRTKDGATLPQASTVDVAAASFATVQDGDLYVGDFENNRMFRYPLDAHGDPITDAPDEYATPTLVQGVAVTDGSFIFTRSYGRTRLSYLTTVDRSTGDEQSTVLPNMAEGVTWAPGSPGHRKHLYVLFESGSAAYGPDDDGGSSTCITRQIWHRAASEL